MVAFARRFVRLPSYLAAVHRVVRRRRFVRLGPFSSAFSKSRDALSATLAPVPHCGSRANTSGSPVDLATGAPPLQFASVGTPASRSAADAGDSARLERTVSYSTGICADLGVSSPAIFASLHTHAKPASADPKNASGGKYIHRPEADVFIWNREVNPPIHWSLSFRRKKIHFIPPLAPEWEMPVQTTG